MAKEIASGVWPVMITPFTEDNRIDYDGVLKIIEWYDKMGVDGIFAMCQSSEMFELTPQERLELIRFCRIEYIRTYRDYCIWSLCGKSRGSDTGSTGSY